MAWSGEIVSTAKNPDGLTLTLVYRVTDGTTTQTITEPKVSDPGSCQRIVLNAVEHRNRVEAQKASIAAFDDTAIRGVVTPPGPAVPTADELARKEFRQALALYHRLRVKLELGLDSTKQSDVDAQLVVVQTLYRPEFDGLLAGA